MSSLSPYALHTVSLPAFFADGFRLASSSSPTLQPNHAECGAEFISPKSTTRNSSTGPAEQITGVKRPRSSSFGTSTYGITPCSECRTETVDCNASDEPDRENVLFSSHGNDGALLLAPTATSLRRMGPSGSWLRTSPTPRTPEGNNGGIDGGRTEATSLPGDSAKAAPCGEFAFLLQTALQKCYATEDELLRRCREEKTREEEEARTYRTKKTREETDGIRACHNLPFPSGSFEQTVNDIYAQKQRRRQQSERMEDQARDIARVKELPLLVEDGVRYARLVIEWSSKSGGGGNTGGRHTEGDGIYSDEPTMGSYRTLSATTPVSPVVPLSDSREPSQMLYAKFPPPLFQTSSFATGVGRLLRWVRTWQPASPNAPDETKSFGREELKKKQSGGNNDGFVGKETPKTAMPGLKTASHKQRQQRGSLVDTKESSGSHSSERNEKQGAFDSAFIAENKKKEEGNVHGRTALQQYYDDWIRIADRTLCGGNGGNSALTSFSSNSLLELCEGKEYGLTSDHVMYDEYGNRLRSMRLARKTAEKRALQDEAQKAREQRRGYFARSEEDIRPTRRTLFDNGGFSGTDDSCNDSDDDDDVTNIAVLHGTCGVGKTAIVYLVAEILGYRVVEMNTSVRRCPKNIDHLLSEVTRSRRLSALASGKTMVSIEEELRKLKSEHISAKKPNLKRKGGSCISAEAIAAFFRPRVRTKSPDVILVDTNTSTAAETATVHNKQVVEEADCGPHREGEETDVGSEAAKVTNGRSCEDDTRTLILFEDADVVLGDEAMKPFYAAVRHLAQRSKVPIVVTVSSSKSSDMQLSAGTEAAGTQDSDAVHSVPMNATQAAQWFGKQTPFTGVESMSRSALFTQLLVVAAVERGLLVMNSHTTAEIEEVEGISCKNGDTTAGCSAPPTLQDFVLVKDVAEFQRLADAVRREVYDGGEELQSRSPHSHAIDMRWWLNRLQYLLLEKQWPARATQRASRKNKNDVGDTTCLLPTQLEARTGAMEMNGPQSYWDAQLGRLLRASEGMRQAHVSMWEWKQLQYAEEIAAVAHFNHALGGIDATSEAQQSSVDASSISPVGDSVSTGLIDLLRGAVPDGVLDRHGSVVPVNGAHCRTTRERIDAFGALWRRTRKTDVIKQLVASRSSSAYEDVIGFGCLLQQPSMTTRSNSG